MAGLGRQGSVRLVQAGLGAVRLGRRGESRLVMAGRDKARLGRLGMACQGWARQRLGWARQLTAGNYFRNERTPVRQHRGHCKPSIQQECTTWQQEMQ